MTAARAARIEQVLNNRQPDITVVLENVFDPHNVAAVMRTADAVGVHEIFVVNTVQVPKVYWNARSARSADKWVTIHEFSNLDDCMHAVRQSYNRVVATALQDDATHLYSTDFTLSTALVFGNEKDGCSHAILQMVDGIIRIPQMGMLSSLNISVACAICLYEAYRQKLLAGHYNESRLDNASRQRIEKTWHEPWQKDPRKNR